MTDCSVRGCAETAAGAVRISEPDAPLLEAIACANHKELIEIGASWNFDGELLMGDDAPLRLMECGTAEGVGGISEDGPGLSLVMELGRDHVPQQSLRVWVTREQAAELADWLGLVGRRSPASGSEDG